MYCDSTGNPVNINDKVKFRGKEYTIKCFNDNGEGACGTAQIEFNEEQHTKEIADEISIDKIWT